MQPCLLGDCLPNGMVKDREVNKRVVLRMLANQSLDAADGKYMELFSVEGFVKS